MGLIIKVIAFEGVILINVGKFEVKRIFLLLSQVIVEILLNLANLIADLKKMKTNFYFVGLDICNRNLYIL